MSQARGQEIQVTNSEKEVLSSIIGMHQIFGHDRDYFYVIKYEGSQYFIEKLDKELNKVHEEPIKLFKGLKTYDLEALVHFHNELYVFVTQRKFSETVLYYQKLDKNSLLPLTELIEITIVEFVKGNWADFHIVLSKHETKLLIASRIKLPLSGAQFNEYFVFDEGLNLVWKRKDTFQFHGQGPRDNRYIVDEVGNVSVLSLLKRETILSLLQEVKNMYAIYRYTDEGNTFREYPLTLPDLFIRGIKIIGSEAGELFCAGLYSEILKAGVRGTFFFKINDSAGLIPGIKLDKFDDAIMADLAGIRDPMINNDELMDYVISDMVFRNNGKIMIIAEQVFNQNYNNYNHLIVTCYDGSGQVYWTRLIRKKQSFSYNTAESGRFELSDYRSYIRETGFMNPYVNNYCSYSLMAPLDKSGIVLFFNENNRNLDTQAPPKSFSNPKKSYIKAVAVDEFGNISEKSVLKWKKKALFPEPIRYYDTLSDTIVIPAFRNRNINYYRISADFIR
jgi:hypothetical protein